MKLEVGKYYSIKWVRPSLFADIPGKQSTVKGKVEKNDLPTKTEGECYAIRTKEGPMVPVHETSIVTAKEIKPFVTKGVKPTNKGRIRPPAASEADAEAS